MRERKVIGERSALDRGTALDLKQGPERERALCDRTSALALDPEVFTRIRLKRANQEAVHHQLGLNEALAGISSLLVFPPGHRTSRRLGPARAVSSEVLVEQGIEQPKDCTLSTRRESLESLHSAQKLEVLRRSFG